MSGDPYYADVAALLHFDGTNGSTTFTDNGPNALTFTSHNSAALETGTVKFGTAAGDFNTSSTAYLTPSSATPFSVGTGDFTWEAWIYRVSSDACDIYDSNDVPSGNALKLQFLGSSGGFKSNIGSLTSSGIATGAWNAFAVTRQSGTVSMFVNGTLTGTATDSSTITASTLKIGAASNQGNGFVGQYMDEFRFTSVCRYTAPYAVQTGPFPNGPFVPQFAPLKTYLRR